MESHGSNVAGGAGSGDLLALAYLVASVCFIFGLKGLSHPSTARRGNMLGMAGMLLAVAVTFANPNIDPGNLGWVVGGLLVGAAVGVPLALRIHMTSMPELVAILHSFVGMAAVLVGIGSYVLHLDRGEVVSALSRSEIFIGVFIGAITFTGSVIAFGKLSGKLTSAPLVFKGQHLLNLVMALIMLGLGVGFIITESMVMLYVMTLFAFVLGVTLIVPIGGADMPVIVSMLNSYSGWAATATGFTLGNDLMIVTGALVGSSGAILSYIMCKAMNRSLLNVLLGGFGTGDDAVAVAATDGRPFKSAAVEDVSFMIAGASRVIVVPGYGMAVAQAQHAVRELTDVLVAKGVDVQFAIHPVAGRMPGHMNVLLAEADISYDRVKEIEEINPDFPQADVVLVLGSNDVVNPAAKTDKSSPIYGMPILDAYRAPLVYVVKRSMKPGYAGTDNDLFYANNCQMVFGDAKKIVEQLVSSLKE